MTPQKLIRNLAVIALTQPSIVFAYWREACSVSQMARLDPIISPGTISAHVHKFAGGINLEASSTGETLSQSSCSTCQVQKDTSAYWTPELYYEHPDGTFESVPNEGMTVYYVGRGGNPTTTKPFPPGFSMISGDPSFRHYNATGLTYQGVRPKADAVSFRCINEANNLAETHYINDTDCVNGWRAQLNFQSCWDGVNLYLPNNAHVAYLSGIDYGVCPPSHPVSIPGLFYEVLYWTNDINQQPGGKFVFSYGDPTGYGFHGDFINGWDQQVLEDAVTNCLYTDNGGLVTACAALVPSNNVNFPRICPQAQDPIPEQVSGNLTALPGCNPVTTVDTTPRLCGLNGSNSTMAAPTTVSTLATATSTTISSKTHPPLLMTASIPLVVTTLTTFVTVTASASKVVTASSAGSLTTVVVAATDSVTTVATSYTYSALNVAAPGVFAAKSLTADSLVTNTITTNTTALTNTFSTITTSIVVTNSPTTITTTSAPTSLFSTGTFSTPLLPTTTSISNTISPNTISPNTISPNTISPNTISPSTFSSSTFSSSTISPIIFTNTFTTITLPTTTNPTTSFPTSRYFNPGSPKFPPGPGRRRRT